MLKKLFAVTAMSAALVAPAHAYMLVNDWTLHAGATTYDSINQIALFQSVANASTITQNGPVPFVGQTFVETGTLTSFGYGDPDAAFTPFLLTNTTMNGKVTSVSSGIAYNLTSGSGTVKSGATTLFDLTLVNGTGNLVNIALNSANNGSSLVLFKIEDNAASEAAFAGQADLLWSLNNGGLFLQVDTDNFVRTSPVCNDRGVCSFRVSSQGSAELFRVPEPESLALLGIGLLGLASIRRKTATA